MSSSVKLLAAIFCFTGTMHFVVPGVFESIVPRWLPAWMPGPRAIVFISGVAEVLGGLGLLLPATRVAAGWGLIALLIAVFPANVQMLVDARANPAASWWVIALWLRLPLQPLLIWWVWKSAIQS